MKSALKALLNTQHRKFSFWVVSNTPFLGVRNTQNKNLKKIVKCVFNTRIWVFCTLKKGVRNRGKKRAFVCPFMGVEHGRSFWCDERFALRKIVLMPGLSVKEIFYTCFFCLFWRAFFESSPSPINTSKPILCTGTPKHHIWYKVITKRLLAKPLTDVVAKIVQW